MVTKAKAKGETETKGGAHPAAADFAKAVKLLDEHKAAEAEKLLESVLEQVGEDLVLKRRARIYLDLAKSKAHPAKAEALPAEEEVQALLNRRDHAGAQSVLARALKAHPKQANLHYLKAIAHAQAEQAEPCAESLKQALALDPEVIYLWRLEPDFAAFRKSSLFAFTEE